MEHLIVLFLSADISTQKAIDGIVLNPFAGGGQFHQYQMMQKSWNPGTWYSSEST